MQRLHATILALLMGGFLFAADADADAELAKAEELWANSRTRISAIPHFREAAKAGHAQAAFRLGQLMRDGFARPQGTEDARYWLRQAANEGIVEARLELAKELMSNSNGPAQEREGRHIMQSLATEGHPEATFLVARSMLDERVDIPAAWQLMETAANAGNALAMVEIADRHWLGKDGAQKNREIAQNWLIKASETGNGYAMLRRGQSHLIGDILQEDKQLALEWLQKSVDAGNGNAMSVLGCIYRDGQLVERDPGRARKLLEASHNADCIPGTINLAHGLIYGLLGRPDPHRAKALLRRAADKGHGDAFYYLGHLYADGPEGMRDTRQAESLFRNALVLGHVDAGTSLAELLLATDPKRRDEARELLAAAAKRGSAQAWYVLGQSTLKMTAQELHGMEPKDLAMGQLRQAAMQGHTGAMILLATEILPNLGDPRAEREAATILEHVILMGDPEAAMARGRMAASGKGPDASAQTAARFFNMALEMGHPDALQALGSVVLTPSATSAGN